MKKKVIIRTDADSVRGMGHLMRCIAIAQRIPECDGECIFYIGNQEHAARILEQYQMQYVVLETADRGKEGELEELLQRGRKEQAAAILIDAYDVTQYYLSSLRTIAKVVYLDDLNQFYYPVDGMINYTWGVDRAEYEKYPYQDEVFLLGREYIPVRKEFSPEKEYTFGEVRNVMLTTGGTDPEHIVSRFLEKWKAAQHNQVKLHVILGKYFDNIEEIRQLASDKAQIVLYENLTNLSEVMRKCEVAVSAGGTTIWELCSVGVATVGVAFVENQQGIFRLEQEGILAGAINMMEADEQAMNQLLACVEHLMEDREYRQRLVQKAHEQIDGMGSKRIAQYLLGMSDAGK